MKILKHFVLILPGLFLFLLYPQNIVAQGTVQATVSGVPPVLSSPYVSDVERNYNQGRYSINIQYNNTDPDPVAFIIEVSLSRFGEELFRMSSNPVVYTPGSYYYSTFDDNPAVSFPRDPLDLISGTLQEQVVREGIIPEGDYILEVEVRPEDPFVMVSSVPSVTPFEVRFPQPPVLISPVDQGNAAPVFSVFSWTPVIGMPNFQFEYEVLIVEVLEEQTPLQAIEANREHARITTMQPTLIYTNEFLELEEDKQYAWQVRAREVGDLIPLSDQGRTEIYTFTVGDFVEDVETAFERIELIPGFAELINIEADISSGPHSVSLDGGATLRLDFSSVGEGYAEFEVYCYDLEVQIQDPENPAVIAGQIEGDLRGEFLPVEGAGEILSFEKIQWSLTEGLTVDAKIIDPAGELLDADGILNLSPAGLQGVITATAPAGESLFSYGKHPVELALNSVTAAFPGAYLTADAQVKLFAEPTPCSVHNIVITEEGGEFSLSCTVDYNIPLVPGTDMATLYLDRASGYMSVGGDTPSLEYSFDIVSSIRINALDDEHYDIPVFIGLSSETGVSTDIQAPPLTYRSPDINLGVAGMRIARFDDPWITYDPGANTWDFGFEFDATLNFPSLDDLELPELYGIGLDKEGIHFPAVNFDEEDLYVIPRLSLAGFGARLTSFTIPAFTFPFFQWDGSLPGAWDFEFDFELTFPEFPGYMPSCLRNLSLTIEEAGFSGGEFSAVMPSTTFTGDECAIELGAGYSVILNSLGGEITGDVEGDELSIDGFLELDAAMLPGIPFDCGENSTMQLGAGNLFMSSEGIISGEVSGLIPACPVSIGPYEATITESVLTFQSGSPEQSALLNAEAYLEFPLQHGGTGSFDGDIGIDLITGEFTGLYFEIDEPFVWRIPSRDEVLEFNINSAVISLEGLMVDGRQEFSVGDRAIGVSFNELLLDLKDFSIKEGDILFDEAFAFEAGIDPGDFSLIYNAVAHEDLLSLDPGILFSLAGSVVIDQEGLRTSGSADAQIEFGGIRVDNLSVLFSDDFAFGLDPFKVTKGRIDVLYDEQLVAVIDDSGFSPVIAFFSPEDVIPRYLPLPHSDIAYLELKDEQDNLLVDIEEDEDNDFAVVIATRSGESVDLVLPILQGDLAVPPRVGVEFSEIGVSLSTMKFESGQLSVDVSGMSEFMDLEERFGLPLSLENIAYGKFDDYHDVFDEGLFFTGRLMLFDEQLDENSVVSMYVRQDGTIISSFDLDGLSSDIPLVADSDIAVININALTGYLEFPLLSPYTLPEYEFNIQGGFSVQYDDNIARANISAGYDRQGFRLLDFEYDITYEPFGIDLDPFIFQIDEIHNLDLSYDREAGFDFHAGLDVAFGMKTKEDNELVIPLQGVEIRPSGFVIPDQEINDGTDPQLSVPSLSFAGIELQALAFRMDGALVDIYNFSTGDLAGLIPRVDFALTFPELASAFPGLGDISLTVNNAGYSNGNFTGSIETYTPLEPVRVPVGSTYLDITEFSGNLQEIIREGEPVQSIDVSVEGFVAGIGIFEPDEADEPCDPAGFSLSIAEGRGFAGTILNFAPCGSIPVGGLSLTFGDDSSLELSFEEGAQEAVLAGSAELLIPRAEDESESVTAGGSLEMDLMSGRLIDGSIEINNAFNWNFPADDEDPFLTFTVNSALLDSDGLTLMAQGEMEVTEQVRVDVLFDNLVVGLEDFRIKEGQATISTGYTQGGEMVSDGFAFELLFLPVQWRMVPSSQQVPADTNAVRLNLDGIGLKLDKDGLSFTGESTADLQLAEKLTEEDDPVEPEEPDEPGEDVEIEFAGLRLAFVRDFRFDYKTYQVTSGAAELYREEEDQEEELIAWYDENGLGLGNILGMMPIPDTLGLPNNDVAYILLRETDPESEDYGDVLVEVDSGEDGRTLSTREGKSVKLVLESLGSENNAPPAFLTDFAITVNSAYEIVEGSINVNLEENPFKVPDLPVSLTSLTYGRGDDGVAALTAGARLELPESLNEMEIIMDELRFSTEGFEQATFSVGDKSGEAPFYSHSFDDDDLFVINVFYASASFGEQTGFGINGTIQSSFFRDELTEELFSLPFESVYDIADALDRQWHFDFNLDELQNDSIAISHARLWLTQIGAVASGDEFAVVMSGTVSVPELLGDGFSVTLNDLSVGTGGISVGGTEVHAQPQQFSLFGGRVTAQVDRMEPEYIQQERVLRIGLDGELSVLERTADFSGMRIGTDKSFSIDGGLDVDILTENIDIIDDHLALTGLIFGISDQNRLRLKVDGEATLPEPFSSSSPFSLSIEQTGRTTAEVTDITGPTFLFEDGEPDPDTGGEMPGVDFGGIASFILTGVDLDLDFDDVTNTTFYASADLQVHCDEAGEGAAPKMIRFGEAADIRQKYGLRYNYDDGLSWNITSTPQAGNKLFTFSAGFFSIDVESVISPGETDFVVELGGQARLNVPGLSGRADFEGFKIDPEGISEVGRFSREGGFDATLMNVVSLSLGNFEYDKFEATDPYTLTIVEDAEDPDPDNPATRSVDVLEYLLIEDAGITLQGDENGNGSQDEGLNGSGHDAYGGHVKRILFYRTAEGMSLQIDSAGIELPAASINVNMTYISNGGYSLSVAGTGKFGFEDEGVDIGVAGKIATLNDQLSFGLFVRADISTGIPVIPGIVTLRGAGGGFYYRPSSDDFDDVRTAAELTYLEEPEFQPGTRWAVFLYAGLGLVGEAEYVVDGRFFFEITDNSAYLHANGDIMGQGDNLKADMFLGVTYGGDMPSVQGLFAVAVDYQPALHGGGEIGFFAMPGSGSPGVIWAVYGETSIDFFIIETSSDFIVCNDGLLANLGIDAEYDSRVFSLSGSLDASVWYYKPTADLGAYGKISAMVSIGGASVEGSLFGALVSSGGERLLYAQGEVNVDLLIWDGSASAWASYSSEGWKGGRGSSPEFEQMIEDSRNQAENLRDAAEEAAANVTAAMEALSDAEYQQELMRGLDEMISDYQSVENARNDMNDNIDYVRSLEGDITERLMSTLEHTIDIRDYTADLARELENPLELNRGSVAGEGDELTVAENPSFSVNESVVGQNESELEEYMENLELRLQDYEQAIARAMIELRQLELMIHGDSEMFNILLSASANVIGSHFNDRIESFSIDQQLFDPAPAGMGGGFNSPGGPAEPMIMEPAGQVFGLQGTSQLLMPSTRNFNYLAGQYTGAVESVKRFYSRYISYVHLWHGVFTHESDEDHAIAAMMLLEETQERYDQIYPPLSEMHGAFTTSLDKLYTIKAEITATLYGMIDEYFILRREMPVNDNEISYEDASAGLDALRNQLAVMLEPPVISSFIINVADPTSLYTRNWVDIIWQAEHPHMMAETSYLIQSTDRGARQEDYTSAGLKESLRHYTWKRTTSSDSPVGRRDGSHLRNTYNIGIRARGSGGNTTIRSSTVSMKIDSGGESSPDGEQLHQDVPPPSTPVVDLPYRSTQSATETAYQPGSAGSPGTFSSPEIERRYFTSDPNRITLTITAHDSQSDIREFEYALGSYSGGSDLVEWTKAVGVLENTGSGGPGVTRSIETTIRGLDLEHEGRYFISVRATNSAGESSELTMTEPLVYDSEPPSAPEAVTTYLTGIQAPATAFSTPREYPVVTESPSFGDEKVNFPRQYAGDPSLTREWNIAHDRVSGIWRYEYILAPIENASEAFASGGIEYTTEPRVTITGDPLTYTDSLYLHVRSRNNAGNVSASSLTYGPLLPKDPTAPTPPVVNVMVGGNGVNLYIPKLSGDYESQVKGYQYSIGTSPGATDIRGWGSEIDIDHSWDIEYQSGDVSPDPQQVPRHVIPAGDFAVGLSGRAQYYVNVRAVNGQNMYSPVVASGPFRYDTRPEEPRITHDFNSKTGELSIGIGNIFDSGLPVSSVRYRVTDVETGKVIEDWTTVKNFTGGKFDRARSVSTTASIGTDAGGAGFKVDVRVTNSAWKSATSTVQSTGNAGLISPMTGVVGTGTLRFP